MRKEKNNKKQKKRWYRLYTVEQPPFFYLSAKSAELWNRGDMDEIREMVFVDWGYGEGGRWYRGWKRIDAKLEKKGIYDLGLGMEPVPEDDSLYDEYKEMKFNYHR